MRLALIIVALAGRIATAAVFAQPEVPVVIAPAMGSVSLSNDGDAAVQISSIVADNTCDPAVSVPVAPLTLPAHGSQMLAISCAAHATGIARCTYRAHDASGIDVADFEAACVYAADTTLASSATTVSFPGSVTVGGSATQTVQITNNGTTGQQIGKLYFQLTDLAGNFAIGAPCNPDARDCTAGVAGVPPGGMTTVEIECTPHAPGPHLAALYIATDTGQRLGAPIGIACTGVTDAANPVFLATPVPVDVGDVGVISGVGSAQLSLQNVGGAGMLEITAARVVDGGNGAAMDWTFVVSGQCPTLPCKLAPGQQSLLAIAFDPSALGVRDAALRVTYQGTMTREIPLRGTGTGATLQLLGPSALDLGTLPIGSSQAVMVQLVNTGNRAVTDITLAGDTSAVTVTPKTLALATAQPQAITITCAPTVVGTTTATITASAPDVVSGSPVTIAATCRGTTSPLAAVPSTIQLGEIRVGATTMSIPIELRGATIANVHLASDSPDLALVLPTLPAPPPVEIQLQVTAQAEGPLPAIVVEPSSGEAIQIPIIGAVVSAAYSAPPVAALGTFCIGQPTTASTLALTSTGSATITLAQPMLMGGGASPFELALIAPTLYPDLLAPGKAATVAITPDRQSAPGTQSDTLVWTTDVAGLITASTKVTATFVDSGGAIAPAAIAFGAVPLHALSPSQQITVQNCNNTDALMLDAPAIELPFRLDAPSDFPRTLAPNETFSFTVSFAPLAVKEFTSAISITGPTLAMPLVVTLTGAGAVTDTGPPDAGVAPPKDGGGCCDAGKPSPCALVLLVILRRRRRCSVR